MGKVGNPTLKRTLRQTRDKEFKWFETSFCVHENWIGDGRYKILTATVLGLFCTVVHDEFFEKVS